MASVHYDILSTVFLTAALFHLQHRTHYLFSSSSKLWFYPHFHVPSHEGLMVREGAIGSREDGWAVHGEISQWGLIMCGGWGKIYFRTRNPLPQHAQAHIFYRRDVRSLWEQGVYDGQMDTTPLLLWLWTPFKTPFPWDKPPVWPMGWKGLKDTQRRWPQETWAVQCEQVAHSAEHTQRSLKDL